MAALEHISLIFIEQRDAHTNEYSLITFSVVTISLLVFNVFSSLTSQNVHFKSYSSSWDVRCWGWGLKVGESVCVRVCVCGVGGGCGNLEWVRRGGALGEEVASVEHGRTHNLHGNSLIFLFVAVRPAAHMVTEWTGCADDQRWGGELERGGGVLGSETVVSASYFCSLSLPSAICRPQELLWLD